MYSSGESRIHNSRTLLLFFWLFVLDGRRSRMAPRVRQAENEKSFYQATNLSRSSAFRALPFPRAIPNAMSDSPVRIALIGSYLVGGSE